MCRDSMGQVEQTTPAAADAHDFMAFVDGAIHHGLDARVQARYVATACQNTNFHSVPL